MPGRYSSKPASCESDIDPAHPPTPHPGSHLPCLVMQVVRTHHNTAFWSSGCSPSSLLPSVCLVGPPSLVSAPGTLFCPQLFAASRLQLSSRCHQHPLSPAFHRTPLLVCSGSCSSTCPKLNPHLSLQTRSSCCFSLGQWYQSLPLTEPESGDIFCSPLPSHSQPQLAGSTCPPAPEPACPCSPMLVDFVVLFP